MEKWSSNPRHFQSLLSAWHLAGWQEGFPSLREAPASCGACRPWLRLAPWPEAAVLLSCGTAYLGMCIYVCGFFSELGLSKGKITKNKSDSNHHINVLPDYILQLNSSNVKASGHNQMSLPCFCIDCCHLSLLHQAAARSGEDPSPRLAYGQTVFTYLLLLLILNGKILHS